MFSLSVISGKTDTVDPALRDPDPSTVTGQDQRRGLLNEAFLWAALFLLFKLGIQFLANPAHFYRDEVTFIESALRLPTSRFDTGDYIHGPVIRYVLLVAYAIVAGLKLLLGQIGNADDFVRWYIESPESLGQIGRVVMSLGGSALIGATFLLASSILRTRKQARVAVLMLLSMPLFHHTAWFVKEDLWAALFGAIAAVVAYRKRSPLLSGLLLGVAIATKYTAVALAPALLVALLDGEFIGSWKKWLRNGVTLGIAAVLAFLALNPYVVINWGSFVKQLGLINAQYARAEFIGAFERPPMLATRVITEFLPIDVGVVAVCSVSLVLFLAILHRNIDFIPAILGSVLIIIFLSISRAGFPRSLAVALPWLAVLASVPFRESIRIKTWHLSLSALLALAVVVQTSGFYRYVTATYTSEVARCYVEQNLQTGETILIEDIHDHITDAGPSFRPSLHTLQSEQKELRVKGAAGKLNLMRLAVAADSKAGRFELLGVKDFSADGEGQLDAAQVIVTCKWPSIFPENRQFNFPENIVSPAIQEYQAERRHFIDIAKEKGFQLLTRFDPSLTARWNFIDRPDPQVLSPLSMFHRRPVVGPVVEIYSRSPRSSGQAYE